MNLRSNAKSVSHDKIRNVAARMIRNEGMAQTSVHKVMEGAGLTVGAFYAHYDSREDLIRDAFENAVEQRNLIEEKRLENLPPELWLERFLENYLSLHHVENRDDGCTWAAILSEMPRAGRETRDIFQRRFSSLVDFFAAAVEKASRGKGSFAEGLGPREIAMSSLGLAFAHLSLARMATDPVLRDEILATGLKAAKAIAMAGTKAPASQDGTQA